MTHDALALQRVLDALATRCQTDLGAASALRFSAAADPQTATTRLAAVTEALAQLAADDAPWLVGHLDIAAHLDRAARGGVLDGEALHRVGELAGCAAAMASRLRTWRDKAPALAAAIGDVSDLGLLAEVVRDAIDTDGTLKDDASPELHRLRREVRRQGMQLRERIESMVRETDAQGVLQDDYYTVRDGRYVLPVRSGEKRAVEGIVHGTSQTGQTFYIEPSPLVAANNKLTLTREDVRREEQRILAELTGIVREQDHELGRAAEHLARADLVFASARLAEALDARAPTFGPRLRLPALRHPLLVLDGLDVIPSDVALEPPQRWLVLSGPNGGGKTVALTAVGLAFELARRGLFVPSGVGAELPWVRETIVVLGDAQDIDAGLSTFSGHLQRVQRALDAVGRDESAPTLVLLDEIASGTEPAAGSALATAVLEAFAGATTLGMATTHYEGLKLLALRDERFVSAAMGLDAKTMSPSFELELGGIGRSSPFELAERMGLAPEIVERARSLAGEASGEVEAALTELGLLRDKVAATQRSAEHERAMAQQARERLDQQRAHEARAADRRVAELAREALDELRGVREAIAEARRTLRQAGVEQVGGDGAMSKLQAGLEAAMTRVRAGEKTATRHARERPAGPPGHVRREPASRDELHAGQRVWHAALRTEVVIETLEPDGADALVRAGVLTSRAAIDQLHPLRPGGGGAKDRKPRGRRQPPREANAGGQQPRGAEASPGADRYEDTSSLRTADRTLDLRGLRVEDAIPRVDAALDAAVVGHQEGLCVVHGVGTGALRKAVTAHLKGHAQVAHFRLGGRGEGGLGATFVWVVSD
jgi:DNA mismatch repair protein MutS2